MFIGQLEMLLGSLFPFRWYILAAVLVVLAALVWIGNRRDWRLWARNHKSQVTIAVLLVLAAAVPTLIAGAAPLFNRSTLDEVALPAAVTILAQGTLSGADEFHFGSGAVSIVETADGQKLVRFDGISVQNGPDLHVFLSTDPATYVEDSLDLGALKATDGSFSYLLPADTDLSRYRSVVIWCVPFGVLFSVAPLTA